MQPGSVERRLSTILAADVVGYSRLVGIDEAKTIKTVKSLIVELIEPKSVQYRGRIVKLMGDGILMEFGSVVDGVLFAAELQGAMALRNATIPKDHQIVFRVGINIGDIVVDGDDIHGDGVNIAARLETLSEPGGIYMSEAAYSQVHGKLDLNFERMGERKVKNIAQPLQVCRVIMDDKAANSVTDIQLPERKRSTRAVAAAAACVVAVSIAGFAWWQLSGVQRDNVSPVEEVLQLPRKPSLAVLPFKAIGDKETVGYFSNGVTNDLIADLSRFHGLFVSASNSVFALQDNTISVKDAARELGVRYILEGSAQHAGSRIRVNANLIEAQSGKNLWSQRYDRDLNDTFEVQDDIVKEIIAALTIKMAEVELKRSEAVRPANMQAYDYYLRGRDLTTRKTRSANIESREMFQTAIELDPGFALAYTASAQATLDAASDGWAQNPRSAMKRAHDLAKAAIDIEPHAEGHAVLGSVYLLMKHFELAESELDKALKLNPNDANSYATLGGVLLWTSKLESAVKALKTSMRLDPNSTPDALTGLGTALFLMKRYQEALKPLENSAQRAPDILLTQLVLAATYQKLERPNDAAKAAGRVRILHPFFATGPYRLAFANSEHGRHLVDALEELGFK